MRVGILTFSAANNYGAVLQAYALRTYVETYRKHEAYVLDYKPRYLTDKSRPFSRSRLTKNGHLRLKRFIADCLLYRATIRRGRMFDDFRMRYMHMLDWKDMQSVDTVIIGSDQVWNSKITKGDATFYGSFANPYRGRIIGYAISSEDGECPLQQYSQYLDRFQSLSVREASLKDQVDRVFNRSCELVVDPVFLLSSAEWCQIEKLYPITEPYMLAFVFGLSRKQHESLCIYAKQSGLQLIEIMGTTSLFNKTADDCNPNQLLYLIHHARKVVTNSFHGLAFSILFEKPVCVIGKKSNERVSNLLSLFRTDVRIKDAKQRLDLSDGDFLVQDIRAAAYQQLVQSSKSFIDSNL